MVPLHDGVPWWSAAAAVSGIGMAMLYPNLSASVASTASGATSATPLVPSAWDW